MPPSQLILWSQGRTGCHLLERMLSNQPNLKLLWHPFVLARRAQVPLWKDTTATTGLQDDLRKDYVERVTDGVAAWERALQESEAEGQMLFVHEHPQFALSPEYGLEWATKDWKAPYRGPVNFTLVPEKILLKPGTCTIFTTRHPAWIVPAAFRAISNLEYGYNRLNAIIISAMRWQRQLYDWYLDHGVRAIIVEAEDYMTSPDLVRELCSEAGLDPQRALFHWPKATEEEIAAMDPVIAALLHSLLNSTGLIPGKAKSPPVLEDEEKGWKGEFGEERGGLMRELVDAAMDDYEYLKARKLTLGSARQRSRRG